MKFYNVLTDKQEERRKERPYILAENYLERYMIILRVDFSLLWHVMIWILCLQQMYSDPVAE